MVALSLAYIASIARITRGSMIEVLHSNFIRTARAKGLPMRRIILRHALKPALLPVLSYMGPAFVGIITGSMVIETIYGLPGIGQLFVNGALNRDYSLGVKPDHPGWRVDHSCLMRLSTCCMRLSTRKSVTDAGARDDVK